MTEEKKIYELIGSQTRDSYRKLHKDRRWYSSDKAWKTCYGLDIDFIEMRNGLIVAFIDIKNVGDTVTNTEEQAYRQLSQLAPVFIVTSLDGYLKDFEVYSYPNKEYLKVFYGRENYFQNFIEKIEDIARSLGYEWR